MSLSKRGEIWFALFPLAVVTVIVPLAVLVGLPCNGSDTGTGRATDECALQAAAEDRSESGPACAADGCALAWTDAATVMAMIVVVIVAVIVIVVVAAAAAIAHAAIEVVAVALGL